MSLPFHRLCLHRPFWCLSSKMIGADMPLSRLFFIILLTVPCLKAYALDSHREPLPVPPSITLQLQSQLGFLTALSGNTLYENHIFDALRKDFASVNVASNPQFTPALTFSGSIYFRLPHKFSAGIRGLYYGNATDNITVSVSDAFGQTTRATSYYKTNYLIAYGVLRYEVYRKNGFYIIPALGGGLPIFWNFDFVTSGLSGSGSSLAKETIAGGASPRYSARPFSFFTELEIGYQLFPWLGFSLTAGYQNLSSQALKVRTGTENLPKGTVFSQSGESVRVSFDNMYIGMAVSIFL